MRLVFISDTHGMHLRMAHPVPDGDVLVHCGDLTGHGSAGEIEAVAAWMGAKSFRHRFAIAGNHDRYCEVNQEDAERIFWKEGVTYLQDQQWEVDGLLIWGAPWTPNFCDWHFMPNRHSPELGAKWDLIPLNTNVLITHGPPHGILDSYIEPRYIKLAGQESVGCELLRARIERLPNLMVHAFGHIHEGYGTETHVLDDGQVVRFVNAAICTRQYWPTNAPIVVDL